MITLESEARSSSLRLSQKWCDGKPWFTEVSFLGAKTEARDFSVSLIDPTGSIATFYVQVKATTKGYSGSGSKKKLKVKVDSEDVRKAKNGSGPDLRRRD